VVEAEGWRVPLYLGGGLVALAIIGVILAIVALSSQKQEVAPTPTPTPPVASVPPGATPTVSPVPSSTAIPTSSPAPTTEGGAVTPVPTTTASPTETATADPSTTGTFPGWTGTDGDYTIIIESANSESGANKVAQEAQSSGLTVGVFNSNDFSSLNGGYWVVYTGTYATKSDAQADLDGVRDNYSDANVRQIKS